MPSTLENQKSPMASGTNSATIRAITIRSIGRMAGSFPRIRIPTGPYGAMDMAGNLMEWCSDWYRGDYYKESSASNPRGPDTGSYRVLRGGCFFFEGQDSRTYGRSGAWPSVQAFRMIGIR